MERGVPRGSSSCSRVLLALGKEVKIVGEPSALPKCKKTFMLLPSTRIESAFGLHLVYISLSLCLTSRFRIIIHSMHIHLIYVHISILISSYLPVDGFCRSHILGRMYQTIIIIHTSHILTMYRFGSASAYSAATCLFVTYAILNMHVL